MEKKIARFTNRDLNFRHRLRNNASESVSPIMRWTYDFIRRAWRNPRSKFLKVKQKPSKMKLFLPYLV